MGTRTKEDKQNIARNELIRKQARHDPVCAEYISQQAYNTLIGGGLSFIETVLNSEEDEDEFRPY